MSILSDVSLSSIIVASAIGIAIVYIAKKILSSKPTPKQIEKKEAKEEKKMAESELPVFLNRERQTSVLKEIVSLSHDTKLFRFALSHPKQKLGLPIGKHIKVYCPNPKGVVEGKWNNQDDPEAHLEEIQRSYTPTSSDDDLGYVDFVIKIYKGGVIERFPDGGKMSQYFGNLQVGDSINLAGPFGLVEYKTKGKFTWKGKSFPCKQVGMIAGGTGITPMLQVINAILKDKEDETKISLLYANQTEEDILVRQNLEQLAEQHPDRFKIWYTLDRPNEGWAYSQGFINKDMIAAHLPPPGDDTVILMCGPPPMIKFACVPNLTELGYSVPAQITF